MSLERRRFRILESLSPCADHVVEGHVVCIDDDGCSQLCGDSWRLFRGECRATPEWTGLDDIARDAVDFFGWLNLRCFVWTWSRWKKLSRHLFGGDVWKCSLTLIGLPKVSRLGATFTFGACQTPKSAPRSIRTSSPHIVVKRWRDQQPTLFSSLSESRLVVVVGRIGLYEDG